MIINQTLPDTFECPVCFSKVRLDRKVTFKRYNYEVGRYKYLQGFKCYKCEYKLSVEWIQHKIIELEEAKKRNK